MLNRTRAHRISLFPSIKCSQLMNNYRLMQQHQHQLRLQQQQIQLQNQQQNQQQINPQLMANANQQGFTQMQSGAIGMPLGQQQQQQQQQPPTQQQPQEMQTILSQNDSKLTLTENLLKQFGANIKQETNEDEQTAVFADSTTNLPNQSPQPVKCEVTSTSRRSPTDLKNEPALKIENIFEPNRRVEFNIQMNSKQITGAVK